MALKCEFDSEKVIALQREIAELKNKLEEVSKTNNAECARV